MGKIGPFIKSKNTTDKMMFNLLLALIPIIVFTVYKNGFLPYQAGKVELIYAFYPLLFILLPALFSMFIETIYAIIILKKRNKDIIKYIKSSYSFFPGLFLGLILPINMPIWIVLLGAFIATLSKMVFGGFGKNWFNPALMGYLFIFIFFANYFQVNGGYLNKLEIDTISSSTPLTNSMVTEGIGSYETLVKPYGNLFDFFTGMIPGSLGETSSLLCLVALIYLIITGVVKWKITLVYLLTVFFATFLIGNINNLGMWYPLFQVLSGGLMFGAVFMATDPVTSPTTFQGQILYGLFLGIITVALRYLSPYPEGVFISILIMNLFVKFFDKIGAQAKFDFRITLLPYIVAWSLIIGIGFYVGNSYAKEAGNIDPKFKIISSTTIGSKTTYIATEKGYVDDIKAEVIINNGKVISYKVLEQKESFFYKIYDSNYLELLKNKQYNLDDVDTVSGATITSTALKKLLQNVINDYNNSDIPIIEEEEKDFEVLSIEDNDDSVVYNIRKKSFGGNMELKVTFIHDIIEQITIVSQNDSYMNLVIDSDFINTLIRNQQNLDNVDTVSGATISSTAIKEAIIKTIEAYNTNKQEVTE